METLPPTLESELPTGLYTEDEKAQVLAQIEAAAGNDRMTVEDDVFRPRKSGVLFPVLVNILAVGLIIGAWFAADLYFQTRQEGLKLRTNKLFSAESKLLAKVLEESKAKVAAANAEIDKIQGDLQKAAADKASLQKSFEDRVSAQDRALRKELADSLDAERKRLAATGLGEAEVTRRLSDFENQKNNEFNARLETYRKQAQAEIEQRSQALVALQAKLQSTVSEQEKRQQDLAKQTKERETALQSQLSSQSADIEALKRDRDDVNAFYRQADTSLAAVRAAFESRDLAKTQNAVENLRQVLAKAASSSSEAVRARALAQADLTASFDAAVAALDGSASKAESLAQIEAVKAQAKKDRDAASAQLAEAQQSLTTAEEKWRLAATEAEGLQKALAAALNRLEGSTADAAAARLGTEGLESKVSDLEKAVAELTPYKARVETLTQLFAASYPTAQDRFKATLGSETGAAVFPGFDAAWDTLSRQFKEGSTVQAARKQALDDVLSFTTYLRGLSAAPVAARDASAKLARADADYRSVIESVQALASAGNAESTVSTGQTQLYGTVVSASATKVALEPLTKVRPAVGQTMELRRAQGKKETILGRGTVLTASNQKIEIDWGTTTLPLSGDAAYLVLP